VLPPPPAAAAAAAAAAATPNRASARLKDLNEQRLRSAAAEAAREQQQQQQQENAVRTAATPAGTGGAAVPQHEQVREHVARRLLSAEVQAAAGWVQILHYLMVTTAHQRHTHAACVYEGACLRLLRYAALAERRAMQTTLCMRCTR
jgi:hypothetical protein